MGLKSVFIMTPGFKAFIIVVAIIMAVFIVFALLDYLCEKTLDRYPSFEEWLWGILGL